MTIDDKVRLWDEINRYVETCGGDPSKHVYGNTRRQVAVVAVEKLFAAAMSEAAANERERCAKYVKEYRDALKGRESTADVMFILGYIAKSLSDLAPAHEKGSDAK